MKLLFYIKRLLQIFLFLAIAVRFTIKDMFHISSVLFYGTPLPLIVLGLLILLLFVKASARKYYAVFAVLLSVLWVSTSYISTPTVNTSEALEVVVWNAYRTENFEDAFKVSGNLPDVMVLVECDKYDYEKIKEKYKNYYFEYNHQEIGIFSKTPFKIFYDSTEAIGVRMVHFTTKNIHFYAVDISANVKFFRKPVPKDILFNIKTDAKTVILGDFNMPYESIYLKNFKKKYQHAFTEKGNGFRETWFWNFPLLSLDHIWVSKDLEILKTDKILTTKSDHTMLKMYLKNDVEKK